MSARVIVVGAGYAGVSAANQLAGRTAGVTVVNPRAEFVERIRLHQLMAGNHSATTPLRRLLAADVPLFTDAAVSIDADRRTVTLGSGDTLDFDYLIYAVGSRTRRAVVPGAEEHAVTVGDLENAREARRRFAELPAGGTVTVVGGGLTGVEVAAELAELTGPTRHRIRLLTSGIVAPSVSDRGRDHLRRFFGRQGVELLEHTEVAEVTEGKIVLADGPALDSDLTVLTAMFEVPPLAGDSGLDVDPGGRLRVDPALVSTRSPAIVGAGDACLVGDRPVRMSCQAAIPLGAHAADTVLRLARGATPRPVRPKFTGQCISLGRSAALWQHCTFADRPTSMLMTGRAGALIKEQICSSTLSTALNPRLRRLSYDWSL